MMDWCLLVMSHVMCYVYVYFLLTTMTSSCGCKQNVCGFLKYSLSAWNILIDCDSNIFMKAVSDPHQNCID